MTRVVASRVRSTSPAPRALPVIACAAMARASRAKARKVQIVGGHLVGGQGHVAEPGRHPGRHQEHGAQGQGAHEQRHAPAGGGEHPPGVGPQRHRRACGIPDQHHDEGAGHQGLGDDRAPRGAGDAPVQPVHEPDVERDVEAEPADGGDERGSGVLQAAQHAGGGEDDEHGGDAERRDPQVGHGLVDRRLEAPNTRATGAANRATSAAVAVPRPIASQVPSMPAAIAPAREPAPSWRATTAVVP